MNHGIIIHPEDFDDLLGMSNEECGLITKNLINTLLGNDTEEFEDRYLIRVSKDMCGRVLRDRDLSERKSKAGKLGGGQFGNSNATKNNQETNTKRAENEQKTSRKRTKTNHNTNTNTNTNTNNKRLYGECQNVRLTDEEHKKLIDKGYAGLIEELSLYIASKGDKYKSHYATVLQWARKREKVPVSKNTFTRMKNRTDYDMDELEKLLVKN